MRVVRGFAVLNVRRFTAITLCSLGIVLAGIGVGANPARKGTQTSASNVSAGASGNWNIVSSPNSRPTPTDNFPADVACASASDCWTVGFYNNVSAYQTLIQHWDGNSWTILNSPNTRATQHNLLRSVTCTSASDCWAVG